MWRDAAPQLGQLAVHNLPVGVLAPHYRRDTQGKRGHLFSPSDGCFEPFDLDHIAQFSRQKRREVLESYYVALDVVGRSARDGLGDP